MNTLFYTESGQGAPLVFIHGLGATHAMFAPQVDHFSKNYRVICPDIRGNGRSARLTGPIRTILDRQTDDLAALLDQLGLEKIVLCGISYGGVFGFHFALRHMQHLAGLVIVDSFGDTRIHSPVEGLLMLFQWTQLWTYYLPGKWLAPAVRAQYKRWPLAQQQLEEIILHLRRHETLLQRIAINLAEHTTQLHRVTVPTLGIVGSTSSLAVNYMLRAVSRIPQARLEIVHDSFDPTNLCQPEIFNRLLENFLNEIVFTGP